MNNKWDFYNNKVFELELKVIVGRYIWCPVEKESGGRQTDFNLSGNLYNTKQKCIESSVCLIRRKIYDLKQVENYLYKQAEEFYPNTPYDEMF